MSAAETLEVTAAKITGSREEDALLAQALERLPEERRIALGRFRRQIDRHRSLLGDLLVRAAAMQKLGLPDSALAFAKDGNRKPYLIGHAGFHYNVSHSGEWVVIAVGSCAAGIDVEAVQPIDLGIAKRFFTEAEVSDIYRRPEEERLSYFFDLWTLKESFLKADGRGLSIPLHKVQFQKTGSGTISFAAFGIDAPSCAFRQYELDPAYKLSVCSTGDAFPPAVGVQTAEEAAGRYLRLAAGREPESGQRTAKSQPFVIE